MSDYVAFTTPVGRMLGGSLYKPQDKDANGNPLVIKNGPNIGQPTVRYWLPVGIPKGPETHWSQTPWGKILWAVGHAAFPNIAASPQFAWKVVDGDSQVPNTKGRKPCEGEGYPGHWVLNFGSTYAPKVCNKDGSGMLTTVDAVKPGYYIQVAGTVAGNGQSQRPGIYLNPQVIALQGFGAEIVSGPDPSTMGFGTAPLPAGASMTPLAGMPATGGLLPPGAPATPVAPPPPPPPATIAVLPNPAFLNPPPAAPVAPAAPVRQMTAAAQGHSYEVLVAQGWTDATLRQHGMML